MLYNFLFLFKFYVFIQSGCYIDFFLKKLCEVFIRNALIYTSQIFGEKYFIEVVTKKIIDKFIYNTNKIAGFTELLYSFYFIQLISVLFYLISFFNIFYLFF